MEGARQLELDMDLPEICAPGSHPPWSYRRMRNCVADYTEEILSESVYFYHWAGVNPATVMLENNNDRGWCLSAVLGPRNSEICQWTYYLIAQRVWWQRDIILGSCVGTPPLMPGTKTNQTERIVMDQGQVDEA